MSPAVAVAGSKCQQFLSQVNNSIIRRCLGVIEVLCYLHAPLTFFFSMRRAVCLELTSCVCLPKRLAVCFQIYAKNILIS